jgi:hypothetical protein
MRALGFRLALTRVFEVADMGDCLAERGLEVGDVNWLGQEVERARFMAVRILAMSP